MCCLAFGWRLHESIESHTNDGHIRTNKEDNGVFFWFFSSLTLFVNVAFECLWLYDCVCLFGCLVVCYYVEKIKRKINTYWKVDINENETSAIVTLPQHGAAVPLAQSARIFVVVVVAGDVGWKKCGYFGCVTPKLIFAVSFEQRGDSCNKNGWFYLFAHLFSFFYK